MNQPAVKTEGLTRRFGEATAVNGLSLTIPGGQIAGIVGPNGAGKTTLLRMLTGVLSPSAGSASICGFDVVREPLAVKRCVGYAPESAAVFESLSALEYLEMAAQLYGISLKLAHERIFRLGDFFELSRRTLTDQLLGAYSKGMRRKVIIASALLHDPAVIIFDEPLDGLDPTAAIALKGLIHALAGQGKTIIYSSHLLDVVERLCDRVIILDHGRLAMDGSPSELLSASRSATLEKLFAHITGAAEGKDAALDVARALTGGSATAE